ncbi:MULTISPECIES: VWA domain-containing protein [Fusobacterium]|jgi:von willebrand factor type A|uniref:vWA domain-containing protein n=1 Tax=Fusobacterium TaxID=848 RepID=UPI000445E518|nr:MULTISPECIES: VWA domain-containing protein [Fusobacterium]EUB36282.1 von Willebrand factor type A domain protein [Fusobacterium sp. OBRC1]WRL72399.1 VWA domain-containing protein [Fusobacterium polymorphum]
MEFTAQPKRVLPLILLADTSSSMREWMRELNTAIRDMLGTLKEQESLKAEIHISFITFGNGGANLHTALTPVSNIEFNNFTEGGMTPLGGALRIAKEMVENREIIPSRSYAPIILLLSDGEPNDNGWENEMYRFINDGRSKKCMRMSLGIGRDYDYDVLKRFSSSGEVYEAKDSTNIIDFFKFMTMTIKEKTLSTDFNATDFIKGINEDYKKIVKDRD